MRSASTSARGLAAPSTDLEAVPAGGTRSSTGCRSSSSGLVAARTTTAPGSRDRQGRRAPCVEACRLARSGRAALPGRPRSPGRPWLAPPARQEASWRPPFADLTWRPAPLLASA